MKRRPLRWLILLPTILTFLIGFGAFAVYIDSVERSNLLADIDDELVRAERSGTTGAAPGNNPASDLPPDADRPDADRPDADRPDAVNGPPASDDVEAIDDVDPPIQIRLDAEGKPLRADTTSAFGDSDLLETLSRGDGNFTVNDPRLRVRVTAAPDGTLSVTALSLDRLDESVADFRRTLLIGGIVILILVTLALWLLTARVVRPVTRMATTATRIADGELHSDVAPPSGSQETAELATALSLMLDRLRATIDNREQAARTASDSRDAMQRFLADMSHELRTPLTALKGYSDLHAGGMLDKPGALDRAMSRIGDESERLNGLVTDMLHLTREEPATETFEPFDPTAVTVAVVDDLRAAHASVTIEVDIDDDAPTRLIGRPARLHQALLNIGSNACRHAPANTSVDFRVLSNGDDLRVEVIDHGPGVDPAEAENIFLPFYRPEASRKRNGAGAGSGGAGLGLAIASQVIERHDGRITVETTPGGGATFIVTLPAPR